jgi:hypothetical protein
MIIWIFMDTLWIRYGYIRKHENQVKLRQRGIPATESEAEHNLIYTLKPFNESRYLNRLPNYNRIDSQWYYFKGIN